MALDRPQEPRQKGTESGNKPLLGEFLDAVDTGRAAFFNSKPIQTVANVERGANGAANALIFNTASLYSKDATKAADAWLDNVVAA
jgi:hypothetical protein